MRTMRIVGLFGGGGIHTSLHMYNFTTEMIQLPAGAHLSQPSDQTRRLQQKNGGGAGATPGKYTARPQRGGINWKVIAGAHRTHRADSIPVLKNPN